MTDCRYCGEPMHTFTQPALVPGKPDHPLCECHSKACPLFMQTFDAREYLTLNLRPYLTGLQYVQVVTKEQK